MRVRYLPALLGANALPAYTGYKSNVNPGIANEFSTDLFRLAHSQLDNEIDRLYHRVFDGLISDMSSHEGVDPDEALRTITLLLVAHNLERISDRVTNVAEDIVFLQSGQVVELG